MEHIKKGDVVYIPFPFDKKSTEDQQYQESENDQSSNKPQEKDRPALFLFKSEVDSFVCCAITTKPHREHKIKIINGHFSSGKIDYEPSFARPNVITTVHRSLIRRKVGTLNSEKLAEIINKVKELLDQEPEETPKSKALERPKRRIR